MTSAVLILQLYVALTVIILLDGYGLVGLMQHVEQPTHRTNFLDVMLSKSQTSRPWSVTHSHLTKKS